MDDTVYDLITALYTPDKKQEDPVLGHLDPDYITHRFAKICRKLKILDFRFHDLRHTFASLLLQQGESLHYVKEQMGHASIQTTVDVYGHIVPWSNRNAVNKLDDNNTPVLKLVSSAG